MKKNPSVSVVIVSYDSQEWLRKCLLSLIHQTYDDFEIIVVDNGSKDKNAVSLKKEFPQIKLITSERNLGFSGGNNLGIKEANGRYILMLNPDTWLEEDFLEKLLKVYQENDFDVVGPLEAEYDSSKIKNRDFVSKIDPFGFSVLVDGSKTKYQQQFNLCGFCLFFKKDFYLKTGGLDNDFFMYIEEIDWFWRLALLGKKVGLAEHLFTHHAGGSGEKLSLRKNVFLWRNQNILQMMLKNYSLPSLTWVLPLYFLQNLLEIAIFILALRPQIASTYLHGWWFNAKNFAKILKKRRLVQKTRIASDWKIFVSHGYWGIGKLQLLFKLAYNRKKNEPL